MAIAEISWRRVERAAAIRAPAGLLVRENLLTTAK
jgi:hypothetical protein